MNKTSSLFHDQNLFRAVVEASPAGMLIADAEGHIILANRAASEQFGYEISELMELPIEQLVPESHRGAHREHRARYMAHPEHRPMAAGRNLFGKRKDGSTFPVDISLHPIQITGRRVILANVLDATDRRRAEQEREHRQAMERLALVGQLAGGVAHEIRTPLCVIRNDAYYLKMLADRLGQDGAECVEEINLAVGKAERIVSEMLDFTRDPSSEPTEVELAEVIRAALQSVAIPEELQLQHDGNANGVIVRVDPEQTERILINLVRNAIQAVQERGRVQIYSTIRGEVAVVEVCDDGPGIDSENVERVFEPLFTTKPKGIGLGLAVSRRYAERNGGSLTVHDGNGSGACFRLTLPLADTSWNRA